MNPLGSFEARGQPCALQRLQPFVEPPHLQQHHFHRALQKSHVDRLRGIVRKEFRPQLSQLFPERLAPAAEILRVVVMHARRLGANPPEAKPNDRARRRSQARAG